MNSKIITSLEEIFLATNLDDVWAEPDRHALERARAIAERDAIDRWREKKTLQQERSAPE
jgi:hypothetical protein